MAALLSSVSPSTAAAGAVIVISGSGFAAGARVDYRSEFGAASDTNPVLVSAGELHSTVPDLLQGMAGRVQVSVVNPGQDPSNELALDVAGLPSIGAVEPLCALGSFKAALGIRLDDASQDARFRHLIAMASAAIIGYCGRDFSLHEYTESYDGDGTGLLRLRHTPIVELISLSIDGSTVPTSDVKVYSEFIAFDEEADYDARLRGTARLFPAGAQNVLVSYRAGFVTVPTEISHACILQAAYLMNTMAKQGIANEGNSQAGVQTAYVQGWLEPAARTLANRYRRTKASVI